MRHPCFMGCEPRGDDDERFFLVAHADLTIYGHTVDAHTREKHPEDWPLTLGMRERGREFACWHSRACPDGELGGTDLAVCVEIDRAAFEQADEQNWPYLEDALTSATPSSSVYVLDPTTMEATKIWDSIEGDAEA